jgi:hypothetical protein
MSPDNSAQYAQAHPLHLRVFLASPGDVADERGLAIKVVEELPYAPGLLGKITTRTVAWDKPVEGTPMLATLTPQEAIATQLPRPSECDFVVVILWSRIGTPLPPQWVKPDGGRYLSGTEWECREAMEAAKRYGKPDVLIYYRTEEPKIGLGDPELDTKRDQFAKVKAFLESFENPDGSIRGSLTPYETPDSFRQKLEKHLQTCIFRLIESRQQKSENLERPQVPLWQGSPFPGLRAFTPTDAPIFFGRDRETGRLVRRLAEPNNRFIAVIGASGSGKSSLVAAGLIPRLKVGAIAGSQDWVCVQFRPSTAGNDPFMALAVRLDETLQRWGQQPRDLAARLKAHPRELGELVQIALAGQPGWAELLLFIDQFEELFAASVDPSYCGVFIDFLAQAAQTERIRTVVTLRADFYARCVELPTWGETLAEMLQTGSYPLAAPGPRARREMITKPAGRAGLVFEEDLDEQIQMDTGNEPGALVLMAFALAKLYEARTVEGLLTKDAYKSFGGVKGSIAKQAEDLLQALDHNSQQASNDVFQELVEVDERGVATRKRALLSRVQKSAAEAALVDAFTKARLLVTDRGEDNQPVVEVAHEALLTEWLWLAGLIDTIREDRRFLRQLQRDAALWEEYDYADTYLWSDEHAVEVYRALKRLRYELNAPLERCDLRLMVASDGNTKDEVIQKFKIEFESKKKECAVLIVRATSDWEKWTIAGFSDAGEFRTVDPSHELSQELKKEPINESRIVELAISSLGRTPLEQRFLGPTNPERMFAELDDPATSHEQRAQIGVRLALLGDPRPGIRLREDGLPDIVWCEVPGDGNITLEDDAGTFLVEPFYIAKSPITWAQYRAFLEAKDGYHNPEWWQGLWVDDLPKKLGRQFRPYDNHPAENVCWLEAVAFCRWLSARLGYEVRLPTEWEWQQAATGGNSANVYPWGPRWDANCANTFESDLQRSVAVGMYPRGNRSDPLLRN